MAHWTERLLNKIKKLYVVRLLLPSDSQEQPLVTTQLYGLDNRGRLRPRQQQKQQILKSSQSFSNSHSQSVPDSGKTEGVGISINACGTSKAALTAAVKVDKPNGDVESSMLLRSSDSEDSTSSTGSSGGSGGGGGCCAPTNPDCASAGKKRRSTPRMRISDSSQVTDAETAALHQFIARHMRRRTRRERTCPHQQPMSSSNCTARLPELDERREQKSSNAEQAPEVSVPASYALPPLQLSQPVLQSQAILTAVPINKLKIRGVGGKEWSGASSASRRASEELLVALLFNHPGGRTDPISHRTLSSQPPQTRSRSKLKFAVAEQAGASSSAEPTRSGRRPRRPRTPDSGVTQTITFNVARDSRPRASLKQVQGMEVQPRRRRWIMPTASDEVTVEVPSPTTSSRTMTTSSTKTVTPNGGTAVTMTVSASPRHRRRRQQQRRLKLRRSETASFQPTFSRIVEWSEATDCRR